MNNKTYQIIKKTYQIIKNKINKTQIHSFFIVLKLFNKFYWKSIVGPFFAFGFSFILYSILGSIMDYGDMFAGIVASIALAQGLIVMPVTIVELKKSVLLKRIGASPIKTWVFTLVIIFYYFFISIIVVFYLMIWGVIFTDDPKMFNKLFESIKAFATFFYGMFLTIIVSLALGFLVASWAKSSSQAQIIGMMIYFPSAFLSGQFLSPEIIAENDVMLWVSKCIPFRYSTMLMIETLKGFHANNPFNLNAGFFLGQEYSYYELSDEGVQSLKKYFENLRLLDDESVNKALLKGLLETMDKELESSRIFVKPVEIFTKWDHIIGLFLPQIVSISALSISIKSFKWSSRK